MTDLRQKLESNETLFGPRPVGSPETWIPIGILLGVGYCHEFDTNTSPDYLISPG